MVLQEWESREPEVTCARFARERFESKGESSCFDGKLTAAFDGEVTCSSFAGAVSLFFD